MGGKLSSSTCLKRALYQISRVLGLRRKPQSARRRDTLVLLSWGMITSILVYCMPREAPRFKGNVNQPDNMLWEETSRDLQDFNWKGKTLGGKWKLSLGFMNIAMWETDLTHYMWLPGEGGGRFKGTDPSSCSIGGIVVSVAAFQIPAHLRQWFPNFATH